jgi:glycine/D-amino acid oxidase-like deaminating enzyme
METTDIAIVGGGAMGAATAFWLTRRDPTLRVTVFERDRSYARSATALSVASIRQQFTTRTNVRISRFGFGFLRAFGDEVGPAGEVADLGLREQGYLFLSGSAEGARALGEAAALQHEEGAETELLSGPEVARRFPWLETSDVVRASFGPSGEGWFDNMGFLSGLSRAARAGGARFEAAKVRAVRAHGKVATGVVLEDGREVGAGAVVLAAGTETTRLLQALHEHSPVEPRKRTVFVIDAPDARHPEAPLMVDHTGFYLRPEGRHWIAATIPENDGPCDPADFEPDHALFEEMVWPRLHARAPSFAAVKVLRCWAGHYDYNRLDQNAIVGTWPGWRNLCVLTGFSGHGLQQAPAMGRGMAELLTLGRFETLDLSELGPERLSTGAGILEGSIV